MHPRCRRSFYLMGLLMSGFRKMRRPAAWPDVITGATARSQADSNDARGDCAMRTDLVGLSLQFRRASCPLGIGLAKDSESQPVLAFRSSALACQKCGN